MHIYQVDLCEQDSDVCFSRHYGIAESIERAMELALAEGGKGFEKVTTLEVLKVKRLAICDFIEKKLRRAA
jgi:hypothetical protein